MCLLFRNCFLCQRQGRSDTYATEFDLEAEEYVPLPKGDVHKKKEVIQDVTLHDLDVANARPQVHADIVSLFVRFRPQMIVINSAKRRLCFYLVKSVCFVCPMMLLNKLLVNASEISWRVRKGPSNK